MRRTITLLLISSIALAQTSAVRGMAVISPAPTAAQENEYQISFTPDQMENLVAPIALYPDPLLAQVLLAATFPDQIDQAARTIRAYNNRYDVDDMDWDVSVKAVAHYPTVLSMMADKLDWTTSLGQAYVNQSSDVMEAIQRLRRQARSLGNLGTTPQQEIVETDGYLYIYPAQPQYIYVPTYDPAIVYFHRSLFPGPVIWFSAGFLIGAWLNHDCDWNHHRVYYHGWERGPIWAVRSRPFVRINNIYVNRRFETVIVNRRVNDQHVNYDALNRYRSIHRDSDFNNVRRQHGIAGVPAQPRPDNQIIRRNINPNDPRIDANRGHGTLPQNPPIVRQDIPRQQNPNFNRRGQRPEIRNQPVVPQPNVKPSLPPSSVFHGNTGQINPRDASRRGQFSRNESNLNRGPASSSPNSRQIQQGQGQGQQNKNQGSQGGRHQGRSK